VDAFIPGLPSFLAQLNLAILALLVNLVVTLAVSAATPGRAPSERRFERRPAEVPHTTYSER
jgi:hypothetical protein